MSLEFFNYIAITIGIAGSIIITWGAMVTVFQFITVETKRLAGKSSLVSREQTRSIFGSYLLLGLDFMLAADMIHTIHNPELNELYALGLIVAIRSVISYFLTKEMKDAAQSKT